MANTRETLGDQATVDGLINHTLTSIEEDGITTARSYALYKQSQLTSVKFPNMTTIPSNMCQYDTGLTHITSDMFPNAGTISGNAFANCTGLIDAEFPNVTSVQSGAFSSCSNLEKFETGTKQVSFNSPFSSCSKFKALVINSNTMSTLNSSTGLSGTAIANLAGAVYVKDSLVDTYKANNNWKTYFIVPVSEYPVTDFDSYDTRGTISDSWAEIIANQDYATDYQIGDTKPIGAGSFGRPIMELIAIDADDRADGDTTINNGKARMTWLMKDCFTTHNMNSSSTNANGWPSTAMRSWLRDTVLPNFPEVVRNNIVEVSKTYYDYTTKTTKTSSDTIWIPSYREMFGGTSYENDGVDYTSKFDSNNARKKYYNGSANGWWVRSAASYGSGGFMYVGSDGSSNGGNASHARGVAGGFCL